MKRNFKRILKQAPLFLATAGLLLLSVYLPMCAQGSLSDKAKQTESVTPAIVLNQVGYHTHWPKVAFLLNSPLDVKAEPEASEVTLVDLKTQAVVEHFRPSQAHKDSDSHISVQSVDFSDFKKPGEYILKQGDRQSSPFQIGNQIYDSTLVTLLRSYYLQRCGVTLDDPMTGLYHPPCHLHDGQLAHSDLLNSRGTMLETAGGWHDAGDYGKYVATTTVTIGRILSLYEAYPEQFGDRQLNIPESGNGISDVLDEMTVGLDWLLRMQRADGGVYRKLSGKDWPIGLAPQEDHQSRYLYSISTPETAKVAATLAMAARIYRPIEPERADTYLQAAQSAWAYLQRHRQMLEGWIEGDDSGSGKYLYSEIDNEVSLTTDQDDRLWAAVELWLTTGERSYQNFFEKQLTDYQYSLFEWKDPSALALADYLFHSGDRGNDPIKAAVKKQVIKRADALLQRIQDSPFELANHRFIWGSNKMAAEEGITLVHVYQLTGDRRYRDAAIKQLDYLLGRNPFDQTFVTGVGDRPVKAVNHLFARSKNVSIPGLFVGGPNSDAQDKIAPKGKGILSYIDSEKSYATNEYAIDYNASLIGLIGLLQNAL